MTLAEAIRLGAMIGPQGRGGNMDGLERCALAGAADVCGMAPTFDRVQSRWSVPYTPLIRRFPILERHVSHPIPQSKLVGNQFRPLMECIWTLNDSYGWTREQIADWVEGIENTLTETPSAAEVPVEVR